MKENVGFINTGALTMKKKDICFLENLFYSKLSLKKKDKLQ